MKITLKLHQLLQLIDFVVERAETNNMTEAKALDASVTLKTFEDKHGELICGWLTDDPANSVELKSEIPDKLINELLWAAAEEDKTKASFATDYYGDVTTTFENTDNVIISECTDPETLTFSLSDPNQLSFTFK